MKNPLVNYVLNRTVEDAAPETMGLEDIYSASSSALGKAFQFKYDDDAVDRYNRIYTALVLFIFSILVSTGSYVGTPMQCWAGQYPGVREDYMDTTCWLLNTYYLPMRDYIPHEIQKRQSLELNYYQWVPMILLLQALMFYLPSFVWRALNAESGINITAIVTQLIDALDKEPEDKKKHVKFVGEHINHCLEFQRGWKPKGCVAFRRVVGKACGFIAGGYRRQGTYLFSLYMFVKFLYLLNIVGQLFILNTFLEAEYFLYGVDYIREIALGSDWRDSGRFPRVTMCDFEIRVLGNLHRHTVQCVLPINMFNEKIYIFVWFWCFLLMIITALNIIGWFRDMGFGPAREAYAKRYLTMLKRIPDKSDAHYNEYRQKLCRFVEKWLRVDGIFVCHLISKNTTDILAGDIVDILWDLFLQQDEKTDERNPAEEIHADEKTPDVYPDIDKEYV